MASESHFHESFTEETRHVKLNIIRDFKDGTSLGDLAAPI